MKTAYQISIFNTNRDFFDYVLESSSPEQLPIGARVWVPFRNKTRLGIIVGYAEPSSLDLKPILECIDTESFFTPDLFALCQWISRYYHAPLSQVLTLALPKRFRLGKTLSTRTRKKKTTALVFENDPHEFPKTLNVEQTQAVEAVQQKKHQFGCFLLQGVTGSGKTEVYLQLAEHILSLDQQVLILVPEIGLTPQLLSRFNARFKVPMAVIHSQVTDNERAKIWQEAKENKIKLVIGTRTALFTPMPHLKLMIIDEEHDPSFKQMDGVRFSARDAGIMRAQLNDIPILLGSATPSLESLHNCLIGKFTKLSLTRKAQNQTQPFYQLVDLRNQTLQEGLAPETLRLIETFIQQKKQVLIFINRRGFSPVLLCQQCGWIADCRACDSHLTLHQRDNKLICHHCTAKVSPPAQCPRCNSIGLLPIGVGTQRIEQTLLRLFPEVLITRIDRDEIKNTEILNAHLHQISRGDPQIIIGTQMLAKGHHFPNLSLVVILDVDTGFYNQDFRALERLGQLITQVAGRAGRAEHPGHIVIQTYLPQHPLLNTLIKNGYQAFIEKLLPTRKETYWPPFYPLALIRAHSKNLPPLTDFMQQIKQTLQQEEIRLFGPAPSPLARKAFNFHLQLLIKASSRKSLQTALHRLSEQLQGLSQTNQIRWSIDVDPVDLT